MKLAIGTRLVGGFLVVVALIAIIGMIALKGLRDVAGAYDQAIGQYGAQAVSALELEVAILDEVRAQKNYLLRGEPSYLEEARQAAKRVMGARSRLAAQPLDADGRSRLHRIETEIAGLDATFEAAVQSEHRPEEADRLLRGKAAAIVGELDALVARAEDQARAAQASAESGARRTRGVTLALIVALGVVAIGLGVALSLSVTLPLKRLQSQITRMADGGAIPSEPASTGHDEVARIAKAFHELVQTAALMKGMETRSKRLAALSTRVARAQEEERERIARELHDGLGQALTAIKLDVTAARRNLDGGSGEAGESLEKARRVAEESLDELRRMVFDLRPPALDHLGLAAALESYCRAFEQRFEVAVSVSADGLKTRLPFDVETALYRISQEALTNISKHAGATRCSLKLEHARDEIRLIVQDNGRGFDAAAISEPNGALRGIGILSMERRAEELGGAFRIESRPGEGTAILVAVPLPSQRRA
ncbi:MAG: histidine kinase [Armatimonadota bacterium]